MNEDIYFEISDSGNSIRICILDVENSQAEIECDTYWLKSKVIAKAGCFSGNFNAHLEKYDFEYFLIQLKLLYNKFDGSAVFNTIENQVNINIVGDGIGHLIAKCEIMDFAGNGNVLLFTINFDQSHLSKIINQLEIITNRYPVAKLSN